MSYTINEDGTVTRRPPKNSKWWLLLIAIVSSIFILLFVFWGSNKNEFFQKRSLNLHGSIGAYPITMNIDIIGSEVKGSYYYNKHLEKLYLSGDYNDGAINMDETTIEGKHTGHFNGWLFDDKFSGEFVNSKGKKYSFYLTE